MLREEKVPLIAVITRWNYGFMFSSLTYGKVARGGIHLHSKRPRAITKAMEYGNNDTAIGG